MSDGVIYRIALVCEGKTDRIVINAILEALVGEHLTDVLQPEWDETFRRVGELGEGWEGVRRWCEDVQREHGSLSSAMGQWPLIRSAALVLHADADIASHRDIQCVAPCPPAAATVDNLRKIVLGWVSETTVPDRVVVCIPSKSLEAWVFVALYPQHRLSKSAIECRDNPESLLVSKRERLVRKESGKGASGYKKNVEGYEAVAERFGASWAHVVSVCSQASRFDRELRDALQIP